MSTSAVSRSTGTCYIGAASYRPHRASFPTEWGLFISENRLVEGYRLGSTPPGIANGVTPPGGLLSGFDPAGLLSHIVLVDQFPMSATSLLALFSRSSGVSLEDPTFVQSIDVPAGPEIFRALALVRLYQRHTFYMRLPSLGQGNPVHCFAGLYSDVYRT